MSRPAIRKLVEGVHMGLGHDGLARMLKAKVGVNVAALNDGDLIMCLNGHGDKMKIIGCRGLVLGYLKMPGKQRIMKDALQFIPRTFGASGFDYDSACRIALEKRLGISKPMPSTKSPIEKAKLLKQAGL